MRFLPGLFCACIAVGASNGIPVDWARDTLSPAYDWAGFPYSWREVIQGKNAITPVRWKRAAANPLLTEGMNARPIWWNDSTIRVFYGVRGPGRGIYYFDVDPENPSRIKSGPEGPIIATGPKGSYDDDWLIAPEPVRLSPTRIRMYYSAKTASRPFFEQAWSLAVAESDDNGKTWTKHARNPIFTTGTPEWERGATGFCSVEKAASGWRMWYLGTNEKAVKQVGYATSTDGLDWQRYDKNPVLPIVAENYWESMAIAVPRVIRDGKLYKVWYASFGPGNLNGGQGPYAAGFAESSDGIRWSRSPYNPVLKHSSKGWDDVMTAYPGVIRHGDRYFMWYSGNGYGGIGFAEAGIPTGGRWYRLGDTPQPDARWSPWQRIGPSAREPKRQGYIQFATVSEDRSAHLQPVSVSRAVARPGEMIYFAGDSITVGRPSYPDMAASILAASFRNARWPIVANAKSGATMGQIREWVEADLSGRYSKAAVVFVQDAGLTDYPLERFEQELRAIVRAALPRRVFLINEGRHPEWRPDSDKTVGPLTIAGWFEYWKNKANPAVHQVAKDAGVQFIDYDARLRAYLVRNPNAPLLEADGVHPKPAGRLFIALLCLKALGFEGEELDLSPIGVPDALRDSIRDFAF